MLHRGQSQVCKSERHGLATTNFVREIATDEWTWDVEAVDDDTPAEVGDERVASIDTVGDCAGKDTKGLYMWSVNFSYMRWRC
jgi:hypothetical protein